jgi:antitoxin MazE
VILKAQRAFEGAVGDFIVNSEDDVQRLVDEERYGEKSREERLDLIDDLDKCINLIYIINLDFMEITVQKWGNSLGVRLPNLIIRDLSLKKGSVVDINVNGNEIIIEPLKKSRLSELLEKINEENIHQEVETSGPFGNEIW